MIQRKIVEVVQVTEQDIKCGCVMDRHNCPFARAIGRLPVSAGCSIEVNNTCAYIISNQMLPWVWAATLPLNVEHWIREFDDEMNVRPIEVELQFEMQQRPFARQTDSC